MKKLSATIGFAAALVGLTGCSLFECTPAPTEPQQTTQPAADTVVTVMPLPVGLTQDKLGPAVVKMFQFPEDTKMASKQYELSGGVEWDVQPSGEWQVVYVVSGDGYARSLNYEMPLAIGNAMLIPAGKTVKVLNVTVDPLVIALAVPSGEVLPDTLIQMPHELSETSNYNGMTTVDRKDVIDARGFDDLNLPKQVNNSPWTSQPQSETLTEVTDPNPAAESKDSGQSASVAEAQTLTPAEAAVVAKDVKESETAAESEQIAQEP
ncbi:MAG: hypothetical protein AB7F40_06065 [Victivallaceae bacterium]|nr:hypothetical protein [Victivallaceae bacterium]